MSNEQYLTVSYFAVGAACVTLGFATYELLRRSFAALTGAVPGGRLGRVLRKVFLIGIVLPALGGFFSVTFRSCGKNTYETIIADRSYLVAKNQEQLATSMSHISIALLVWGLIVAVGLVTVGKKRAAESQPPPGDDREDRAAEPRR